MANSVKSDFFKIFFKKILTLFQFSFNSKTCGSLEYYDRTYDRLNTKTSLNTSRLKRINRVYHKVTTTDDPVIRSVRIIL